MEYGEGSKFVDENEDEEYFPEDDEVGQECF